MLLDPMFTTIKPNSLPDRFRDRIKQGQQIVFISRFAYPIFRNSVCSFQMLMCGLDRWVVNFIGFLTWPSLPLGIETKLLSRISMPSAALV
ncbi:hypothetical protein PG5_26020 [Pseudomonas sp. G5(2012)]|jgi:hypothetical protein|nr:hypothetical protein PG5_26020 [Pseudomonas sp. G5(2012)]